MEVNISGTGVDRLETAPEQIARVPVEDNDTQIHHCSPPLERILA
jgi:hypothetical protein